MTVKKYECQILVGSHTQPEVHNGQLVDVMYTALPPGVAASDHRNDIVVSHINLAARFNGGGRLEGPKFKFLRSFDVEEADAKVNPTPPHHATPLLGAQELKDQNKAQQKNPGK